MAGRRAYTVFSAYRGAVDRTLEVIETVQSAAQADGSAGIRARAGNRP
jgi:hypothetical protein